MSSAIFDPDYNNLRGFEREMMDTTSYGVRSAEARSIFCDQSAVYVRIIARLASAKFTLLPRSGSASWTADGE